MKHQELILRDKHSLVFQDGVVMHLRVHQGDLEVRFDSGKVLMLRNVIDRSETLEDLRVFVVEGRLPRTLLLLGGRQTYLISSQGYAAEQIALVREDGDEEYWSLNIFHGVKESVVLYEGGILVLDDLLAVRFHQKKLFNDKLIEMDERRLKFQRNESIEWYFNLDDGAVRA